MTPNPWGLTARSAFAGLFVSATAPTATAKATGAKLGLVAMEREGLSLATVSLRRGQRAALQDRMAIHFGLALPDGPRRVTLGAIAAAGIGPTTWLLTREEGGSAELGGSAWTASVKRAFGDTASVVDQSDAYAVLRLKGPLLRETLAKLVPLDLHARAFKVGDVAATLAAQMGALLWRLEDDAGGQPKFELAVARSMAESFWHALAQHDQESP